MKKNLNFVIKESITEALLILIRKKPFEEITITEISKLAGVSRVSFYRNFDSKEDVLVKHLFERSMQEFTKHSATTMREKLIAMFKAISGLHEILDVLYQHNLSHLFLYYLQQVTGAKPENENTEAYQQSMKMGLCFGALDEWIRRGRQESPEEMVEILQNTLKPFFVETLPENA